AWMVTLTARHPALWAWVQLDSLPAVYSNNYLHLRAGEPVVIEVKPEKLLTAAEFKRRLKVSSLVDTYQDPTVYA
ncbi:MAG: glycoside hydrolase family 2 protein, partial [bacterium]